VPVQAVFKLGNNFVAKQIKALPVASCNHGTSIRNYCSFRSLNDAYKM
jgi:hypothetical protein